MDVEDQNVDQGRKDRQKCHPCEKVLENGPLKRQMNNIVITIIIIINIIINIVNFTALLLIIII